MSEETFGIYIHWPWCARICPYCDFNVHLAKRAEPELLVAAICEDIASWRRRIGERRLGSVFFGGGTPSLMSARGVEQILDMAARCFSLEAGAEISLEANPEDFSYFADLSGAGINRFSLGVQSLCDRELKFLGRGHKASEARRAVMEAQRVCDNVSIDLIYALPGQSCSVWEGLLSEALSWGLGHLSLYTLTVSPGTAFGRRAERGKLGGLADDEVATLFQLTQELVLEAGLQAYEISNHAADVSVQSRHNRLYWEGGEWLGVGPGAHGRLGMGGVRHTSETLRLPGDYIAAVRTGVPLPLSALTRQEEAQEYLLSGLRLVEGVSLEGLAGRGLVPGSAVMEELEGLIELSAERLALTESGRLLADAITRRLLS